VLQTITHQLSYLWMRRKIKTVKNAPIAITVEKDEEKYGKNQ
jgi:hypothetical protein